MPTGREVAFPTSTPDDPFQIIFHKRPIVKPILGLKHIARRKNGSPNFSPRAAARFRPFVVYGKIHGV